ncbi:hypothetical protein BU25DRAFT_298154, partial [Macroventuria anomochaeta]
VLNNAYDNDTAVNKLAAMYNFTATNRRLRCSCHILNLIGQTIIFGRDNETYSNDCKHYKEEQGDLLGVFLDVINHINIPQQYQLFASCQRQAVEEMAISGSVGIREPIKPVVTCWNSYCSAFERGVELQQA